MADILAMSMFVIIFAALMVGYNVAFTLAGVSLFFAALGVMTGTFDTSILLSLPGRIYPIITREMLIAVPLFVFMGVMLEKSRIAEELLESIGDLLGPLRGGLGISVILVGALLAASTGIVGATVVTMGLLSLPTMLKRGYAPSLAAGTITASGTLGQIIPPSIVLVVLGDQISNAYQEAQRTYGLDSAHLSGGGVVSVGDLFAGALIPGLILVGLYAAYIALIAQLRPKTAPAQNWPENVKVWPFLIRTLKAMLPPIFLIIAVLGSILLGYATPTRGAALGALGAILLASYKISDSQYGKNVALLAAFCLLTLIGLDISGLDLRLDLRAGTGIDPASLNQKVTSASSLIKACALFLFATGCLAALYSAKRLLKGGQLAAVSRTTLHITSMVFVILIGATIFSLVFRGFGGDDLVARLLAATPGGKWGALVLVMAVMFVLGFFLDFIEITFVVVPLVAPPLLAAGMDPVWLGILMALNLQTSFLTPPFGFALFYLRSVAPPEVTTTALYRGVLPFILIQILVILAVMLWPELATSLPVKMAG